VTDEPRYGLDDFNSIPGEPGAVRVTLDDFKDIPGEPGARRVGADDFNDVPLDDDPIELAGGAPGAPPTLIVPPPERPLAVAREFIATSYAHELGPRLVAHRGLFYEWVGTHWTEIAGSDVRAQLYRWLERAFYWKPEKDAPKLIGFDPTRHKIANVIDALAGAEHVPSDVEPPAWRRGKPPWGDDAIVAMQNGVIARASRALHPHSPLLFNRHVLPFAYDPNAPTPARWLRFLRELWENDEETIATLQEVLGYIVGGGTEQQKLIAFIGPKRSGKGTIARVLTALLGPENVVGPTLSALATQFGLASLIGKPLAAISDARLGKQRDAYIAVERLLAISGEDTITVPRKYKDDWTGRLPTRFVLLSNELPAFEDASATIASRFIILMFRKSFYGRENPRLTEELLEEAAGIFNWALEGLDRLVERGRFEQPSASASAIRHLEDLASPVSAFVRDRCVIDPDATEPKDEVWKAWKEWAEDAGVRKATKDVLLRDLRAVEPSITSTRPTIDGKRVYVLSGLRLQVDTTVGETPDRADREGVPSTLSRVKSTVSPASRAEVPFPILGDEMYPLLLADAAENGHITEAEFDATLALHNRIAQALEMGRAS
jgi:putative DNA primase/helicase